MVPFIFRLYIPPPLFFLPIYLFSFYSFSFLRFYPPPLEYLRFVNPLSTREHGKKQENERTNERTKERGNARLYLQIVKKFARCFCSDFCQDFRKNRDYWECPCNNNLSFLRRLVAALSLSVPVPSSRTRFFFFSFYYILISSVMFLKPTEQRTSRFSWIFSKQALPNLSPFLFSFFSLSLIYEMICTRVRENLRKRSSSSSEIAGQFSTSRCSLLFRDDEFSFSFSFFFSFSFSTIQIERPSVERTFLLLAGRNLNFFRKKRTDDSAE